MQFLDVTDESTEKDAGHDRRTTTPRSAAEELAEEIRRLKEDSEKKIGEKTKKKKRGYARVEVGACGVLVFRVDMVDGDVESLVTSMFERMRTSGKSLFRYCTRVLPMQTVVAAKVPQIVETAKKMIAASPLLTTKTPRKFRIVFRRTMNTTVGRNEVIKRVADLVGSAHAVDLTKPDVSIIVQCVRGVCGLTISSNHHRYEDFNGQKYADRCVASSSSRENGSSTVDRVLVSSTREEGPVMKKRKTKRQNE